MPAVDPRKLRQLVMVEKTVHRLGRQHIQKYWVRPQEDARRADEGAPQRVGKPRPLGFTDEQWKAELERRRIKNEYVRQWRAKRKEQGLLKKPGDPPPPLPRPIPPGPPPPKKEDEEDERTRKRREYVKRWREKQKLLKQQGKPPEKPPPEPEKPRGPGELKDWTKNLVRVPARKWMEMNNGVLRALGNDLVAQFKTTPPDVEPYGVNAVEAGREPRGIRGHYVTSVWQRGTIRLQTQVARDLVAQVRAGGVATPAGSTAICVLTHEMFHAASHPGYEYEDRRRIHRPHAAMQEATTEILAQMHKAKVMTALGVEPRPEDAHPVFGGYGAAYETYVRGEPISATPVSLARATAYPTYVRQFGRTIAAIEGPENLDQNVERWAREIKGTRGNMRYERVADALIEKHGMPRDNPNFSAAREKLSRTLHTVLQGEADVQRISEMTNTTIEQARQTYQGRV